MIAFALAINTAILLPFPSIGQETNIIRKIDENCFNTSVLQADLNFEKLMFSTAIYTCIRYP